ncbi:hypothetical protein DUI87_26155 [Hirundo rustica rustica]|uniref:Integrase catalytic domain-containing protein n=1 Tax=Hirundo rustica rustica TaxID=333673 RepID=A0A3M0JAQ4_HIRRU|nr:hypothetical protein DUI87_26155 [Hirundo rustica rustica]
MVANALWDGWEKWKKANWQRRGKPIWAADEWKDIATRVEKLPVKVRHVEDAMSPRVGLMRSTETMSRPSGQRDATYKWAEDRGVDLTMDSISQVIHDCETCAAIKQAKRVKPLWGYGGGDGPSISTGEAWQIDYITLPQTRQGKRYVLTMVEATTRMAGDLLCASRYGP